MPYKILKVPDFVKLSILFSLLLVLALSPIFAFSVQNVENLTPGANNASNLPSISPDGRYVAFGSTASNLTDFDTEGMPNIFVRDTQEDTTVIVSVGLADEGANGPSFFPSISSNGRYVAFSSLADNLVEGDENKKSDIFVRDTQENTTIRVSVDSDGNEAGAASLFPSISSNGRYVSFVSNASDLVDNDTNGVPDIFVRDTQENTTIRVSVDSDGNEADGASAFRSSISADGRYVAFRSSASNLTNLDTESMPNIFVRDTQENTTVMVSAGLAGEANGPSFRPSISPDGRYVVFESYADNLVADDTNDAYDVFMRDLEDNTTTRVSVSSDGEEANAFSFFPTVSSDGRYVAFNSIASNLVEGDSAMTLDTFVRDTQKGQTMKVHEGFYLDGDPDITKPGVLLLVSMFNGTSISSDGRRIAFVSADSLDGFMGSPSEGEIYRSIFLASLNTDKKAKTFHEDSRCLSEKPGETTWIKLEPTTKDGISGMLLTWVQYGADKVDIKIDDGSGNYPWMISNTPNDGNEFLPNVTRQQAIKIKPINDCEEGDYGKPVSYSLYPYGWYNVK